MLKNVNMLNYIWELKISFKSHIFRTPVYPRHTHEELGTDQGGIFPAVLENAKYLIYDCSFRFHFDSF